MTRTIARLWETIWALAPVLGAAAFVVWMIEGKW